jgi:hypothetical protein
MARLRYNNLQGTLGASLTNVATAVTFSAALTYQQGTAVPTIVSPDYIPLTLEPGSVNEEVVQLTAYTAAATTGTITRGSEGAGVAHSNGVSFVHAPTAVDFLPAAAVFNVKEYGAKGDGVTNDYAAITSAITAAGANGRVFFPPTPGSSYLITATGLTMLNGQWWDGYGATIKAGTNLNLALVNAANPSTGGGITGLTLDGNKANQSGGAQTHTFVGVSTAYFSIRDVTSVNAYLNGIYFFSATDTSILNCTVKTARNDAINTQLSTRTRIAGCSVISPLQTGINNGNGSSLTVTDCVVNGAGFIGIGGGSGGTGMTVTGCVVTNCGDHAIDVGATLSATVVSNYCYNCTAGFSSDISALGANADANYVCVGNTIDTMSQQGMNIASGSFISSLAVISDNVIRNVQGMGITMGPNCAHYAVQGNVIHNAGLNNSSNGCIQLYGACTDFVVSDNVCYIDQAGLTSAYGIVYGSSGQARNSIYNNKISTIAGGVGYVFNGTPSTTDVIRNNMGLNPFTLTAPAFPATTVLYTNQTGYDTYAYIANGTSAMTTQVNGNTGPAIAASTAGIVFIPAGGTFKATYGGGAPTWVFQGN